MQSSSGWWFQTFFIFHNIWDNPSHWLIFFKMGKTTNQSFWVWSFCEKTLDLCLNVLMVSCWSSLIGEHTIGETHQLEPQKCRDVGWHKKMTKAGSWWIWWTGAKSQMAMDQYLLIQFLGGWTSIYQLFWCSPGVQGFDTLPYGGFLILGYPQISSILEAVLDWDFPHFPGKTIQRNWGFHNLSLDVAGRKVISQDWQVPQDFPKKKFHNPTQNHIVGYI